jgi:hypothetical protein
MEPRRATPTSPWQNDDCLWCGEPKASARPFCTQCDPYAAQIFKIMQRTARQHATT